jgi:dihydroorotate dehydrogenase
MPAESAHEFALTALRAGLITSPVRNLVNRSLHSDSLGPLQRLGISFPNPIGLAAGFDKNGVAVDALAALGFGFIEVGTVTNEAQPGNPKPRIFRLPSDRALINRLGFNNDGADAVAGNLRGHRPNCILGVNIGKSRSVAVEEAIPDYLASFEKVFSVADYVTINVSSPNTPNLRELQRRELLEDLLKALQSRNRELGQRDGNSLARPKPLLLKIAPDLDDREIESIVDVALRNEIAGIIATNTTIQRDHLSTPAADLNAIGEGGLSGVPLRTRSNEVISTLYRMTSGRLPIIGVGGVFTAEDAWEKIRAGAGLIQIYTGLIYEGPSVARRINRGLAAILEREGFNSLDDAVGCHVK